MFAVDLRLCYLVFVLFVLLIVYVSWCVTMLCLLCVVIVVWVYFEFAACCLFYYFGLIVGIGGWLLGVF